LSTTASLLTAGPKRSDDLSLQWKRRTILTTEATFPHLRRRLEVVDMQETDLCPIDAAIDAISCKNQELRTYIDRVPMSSTSTNSRSGGTQRRIRAQPETNTQSGSREPTNIPFLMDMHLQGALLTTVNAGPMAYAEAFLKLENQINFPSEKVARLRELFL
ncbi:uncharacterized protein DEA37_0008582, partial [Paragonimus westermani]